MRDEFFDFYSPTAEQLRALWDEALIVLDTNTLLDLYRFPSQAREELLSALNLVADRLWIPHQVALEFQRQRLNVIRGARQASDKAVSAIQDMVEKTKQNLNKLEVEKRGLGIATEPLIEALGEAAKSIESAFSAVKTSQPDVSSVDAIRDRVDALFQGRIGPMPRDQPELDALIKDGEDRYAREVPPGFKDADKAKNPTEAMFYFSGLQYQRKFGDLILWRQLIEHVKQSSIKMVMFITSETKEDWWWDEGGRTMGPLPSLVREMRSEGGVELFWMYGPDQFLRFASTYTQAKVSDESVQQIGAATRAMANSHAREAVLSRWRGSYDAALGGEVGAKRVGIDAVEAFARRLSSMGQDVEIRYRDFPDIIAVDGNIATGYDIKHQKNLSSMLFAPPIVNAMLRGYYEVNEEKIDRFIVVIACDEEDFFTLSRPENLSSFIQRIDRLLSRYTIDGITR